MASHIFAAWGNFYLIIGAAGATLIGVQFVVMTLVSARRKRPTVITLGAFATPTVVHFGSALLVSAIMCVPWPAIIPAAVALMLCGGSGLGYGALVVYRARRQTSYRTGWDDWLWYAVAPCGGYATLALAAPMLSDSSQIPMFAIGAAAIGLLLVGIRNAWDTVIYIVVVESESDEAVSSDSGS